MSDVADAVMIGRYAVYKEKEERELVSF